MDESGSQHQNGGLWRKWVACGGNGSGIFSSPRLTESHALNVQAT